MATAIWGVSSHALWSATTRRAIPLSLQRSSRGCTAKYFATASSEGATVGFIGLGNMGLPMATNLMKGGYKLLVYDKDARQLQTAKQSGAHIASNIKEVAQTADVVVTMLPASAHVEAVYLGKDGLFDSLPASESRLLLDCSTVDPTLSRRLNEAATQRNHLMVDAPVSGGVPGAVNATLTFMVGGSDKAVAEAQCYLERMGKRVVVCGGPGKGSAVKVCNNLILGVSMMGVAEAYRLAKSLEVDLEKFNTVVNSSSGRCWASESYNPVPGLVPDVPASRDYSGGFGVDLIVKDLGLALTAGNVVDCKLPATQAIRKVYEAVGRDGHGQLDFGCVYKYGGRDVAM